MNRFVCEFCTNPHYGKSDKILIATQKLIYIVYYNAYVVDSVTDKVSATGRTNTIPFRVDFCLHFVFVKDLAD